MLAPEQTAIGLRQRDDLLGHRAHQALRARRLHVDRRADVEHAGIDVAEHAVIESVAVEDGPERGDEVG